MEASRVRVLLESAGFGEHAEAVEALVQPAVRIVATALAPRPADWRREGQDGEDGDKIAAMDAALQALPLGASRFGGVPDLPPGAVWPERDGVPMEFIAQIRLADAAPLDAAGRLPDAGTLLFFFNSQWDSSDMAPGEACCAVLFYPGSDAELVRATPPRIEWKSPYSDTPQIAPMIHGLAGLAFEATSALPGGVSPFITEPLTDFWQDFQSEHGSALAGDAPYSANYLLGYVDEQDYVDAHANGTDDQLLLQVDSCDAAEFQFGDCNKLFFLITRAELEARDFGKVRLYSMLG